jgi:hypothetical protein
VPTLLAVTALVWLALLVAAPVLPPGIAAALYAIGSQICHQQPDRSSICLARSFQCVRVLVGSMPAQRLGR